MNNADEISQAERRRIMIEERRGKATYHNIGQAGIDETFVRRVQLTPEIPKPAGSGWASLWTNDPPEPALGYSVEQHEAAGEAFEVAASQAAQASPDAPDGGAGGAGGPAQEDGTTLSRPAKFIRRF
jgi:hypothetical protein